MVIDFGRGAIVDFIPGGCNRAQGFEARRRRFESYGGIVTVTVPIDAEILRWIREVCPAAHVLVSLSTIDELIFSAICSIAGPRIGRRRWGRSDRKLLPPGCRPSVRDDARAQRQSRSREPSGVRRVPDHQPRRGTLLRSISAARLGAAFAGVMWWVDQLPDA